MVCKCHTEYGVVRWRFRFFEIERYKLDSSKCTMTVWVGVWRSSDTERIAKKLKKKRLSILPNWSRVALIFHCLIRSITNHSGGWLVLKFMHWLCEKNPRELLKSVVENCVGIYDTWTHCCEPEEPGTPLFNQRKCPRFFSVISVCSRFEIGDIFEKIYWWLFLGSSQFLCNLWNS